jgi:hypothetical protein
LLPEKIKKLKELACAAIDIIFEDTIDISDNVTVNGPRPGDVARFTSNTETLPPELEVESPFSAPPLAPLPPTVSVVTPVPATIKATTPLPVAPPTPAPVLNSTSPDLDKRGIKWDERIHASSQALMKNGEWRNKRGVNKDLLAQVEAELIGGAVAASVAAEPIPAPPAPTVATPPIPTTVAMTPTIPQAIEPAVPASIQPPVTHPTYNNDSPIPTSNKQAHTLETFKGNIVNVLANLVKDGKITQEYVEALKVHFEVAELWQVFGDESKVEELFVNFCNMGLITNVE